MHFRSAELSALVAVRDSLPPLIVQALARIHRTFHPPSIDSRDGISSFLDLTHLLTARLGSEPNTPKEVLELLALPSAARVSFDLLNYHLPVTPASLPLDQTSPLVTFTADPTTNTFTCSTASFTATLHAGPPSILALHTPSGGPPLIIPATPSFLSDLSNVAYALTLRPTPGASHG
ncbi:MAG: hypothetical protein ACK5U7_11365 [Bacteroidota bacterium]|jgi:hypothetical protein